MLSGTFTVRCWNCFVGMNRGFIELMEDANISVTDHFSRFNIIDGNNSIECYYHDGMILNKKTDRKICEISYKEVSYNYKPSGHEDHEMEIFVCIKDWVSAEDFLVKARRSNSFKNSGDIVQWDDCVGEVVETPKDHTTFLKFTVTAVGEKNFLAIDENGDEKMFPKMDGFWFYV